jgi:hypothetical protein
MPEPTKRPINHHLVMIEHHRVIIVIYHYFIECGDTLPHLLHPRPEPTSPCLDVLTLDVIYLRFIAFEERELRKYAQQGI